MKPIHLVVLTFLSVGFTPVFATDTWSGSTSGDASWNDAVNWSAGVPTGTLATFSTPGSGTTTTLYVTANTSTPSITFGAGSYGYTIGSSNGGVLTLDSASSSATQITSSGGATGTQTFSGNVVLQNSGTGAVTLNISGGEVLFSNSSSLTINKSVGTLNGGATLKIAGALTYGNGTIAVTWAPSAVVNNSNFTYDPTSVTFGTGTYSLISTGSFSRIELQQGITTGYSGVFVGSTSTGGGSGSGEVYLNASQISIAAPVTMGAAYTGTNTLTGTYTVGMDVSSAATGTVSGNITLLEPSSAGTQTDNFDVATSNTLTVSGAIANKVTGTGSAATSTVTKTSGGTLILSNTGNSYSSPTTVSAGSLLAANGSTGSAVGTGSLTVASGATIGGYSASASTSRVGTFKSYGFTIGTGGSAANVIVGDGTDATSSLALESITGYSGTFTGSANLVFNLDSASTHSNVLTVAESGSSNSVVFKGATLTLNVIGSGGIITSGTQYDLINDASGFNASTDGLTLVTNSMNQQVITSGLSLASNTYFGSGGFYSPSYLFLSSDDTEIEVEVVPEPSTWAMLMGGAAGLALVLRRRARGAV